MAFNDDTGENELTESQRKQYDDALNDLNRVHGVYRDMLEAYIASCEKHRVMPSRNDIDVFAEGLGESLADNADHALGILKELGFYDFSYTPENAKDLCAAAHEKIIAFFWVKPVDCSALFDALRPVNTNPATYEAKGEKL